MLLDPEINPVPEALADCPCAVLPEADTDCAPVAFAVCPCAELLAPVDGAAVRMATALLV